MRITMNNKHVTAKESNIIRLDSFSFEGWYEIKTVRTRNTEKVTIQENYSKQNEKLSTLD